MQLTRFRNVENFHAFPFKFCTLNSVLKLSSANPEMAVSLFLLHWRQHKDSSCSPTASTPMQVFFVFSSGSQACAYHCCFPELRTPAHSCLDVPFPKTAFPSLIVNSPLCVTPPTKSPPAAGLQGFLSLSLQHGVALLSTSAAPQKSGCSFSHSFCDTLVFALLSDVFALHPSLPFFIPPMPPCPPSSRTSGEATPSVLLQTCVKLSFSQHSPSRSLTHPVKSLRRGLLNKRNCSWLMELTKPETYLSPSSPGCPHSLHRVPVSLCSDLSMCSFVPSLVLSSVPRLWSVGQQVLQLAGC